jgi:hypothetical protein
MSRVPHIFLSYASEDRRFADQLKASVRSNVSKFSGEAIAEWDVYDYDREGARISGGDQKEKLKTLIHNESDYIIFILSENFEKGSDWISHEINYAKESKMARYGRDFAYSVTVPNLELSSLSSSNSQDFRNLAGDAPTPWDQLPSILRSIQVDFYEKGKGIPRRESAGSMRKSSSNSADFMADAVAGETSGKLLVEFLEAMKRILNYPRLPSFLMLFLPARNENQIPGLRNELWKAEGGVKYKEITGLLNRTPNRNLKLESRGVFLGRSDLLKAQKIREAVVKNIDGEVATIAVVDIDNVDKFQFGNISRLLDSLAKLPELQSYHRASLWSEIVRPSNANSNDDCISKDGFSCSELPNVPYFIALRATPDNRNRDILGMLLPMGDTEYHFETRDNIDFELLNYAINDCFPIVLRQIVVDAMKARLKKCSLRRQVQSVCLDAALALTGADWGCIKSHCIAGPVNHSTGLVSAEAVCHCPVFYEEGVFDEAETKIKQIILSAFAGVKPSFKEGGTVHNDKTATIKLGTDEKRHPSEAAFVVPIQLSDSNKEFPVFGAHAQAAIVVQHVELAYFRDVVDDDPTLRSQVLEVANAYSSRLNRLALGEAFTSVSKLREQVTTEVVTRTINEGISHQQMDIVPRLVDQTLRECLHQLRHPKERWIVVWWDTGLFHGYPLYKHQKEIIASSKRFPRLEPSSPTEESLAELCGLNHTGEMHFMRSLLYYACSSRRYLIVPSLAPAAEITKVQRHRLHSLQFNASFSDNVHSDYLKTKKPSVCLGNSSVVFRLFNDNPFDAAVIPLTPVSGDTVGALVLAVETSKDRGGPLEDEELERIAEHEDFNRVARVMFQLRLPEPIKREK